ncbi:MAG: hypothetical protein KDA85_19115 [Planctomycetaceae bacterium]|nr:hypothetical protein [Planctomycetaceae bacterium]
MISRLLVGVVAVCCSQAGGMIAADEAPGAVHPDGYVIGSLIAHPSANQTVSELRADVRTQMELAKPGVQLRREPTLRPNANAWRAMLDLIQQPAVEPSADAGILYALQTVPDVDLQQFLFTWVESREDFAERVRKWAATQGPHELIAGPDSYEFRPTPSQPPEPPQISGPQGGQPQRFAITIRVAGDDAQSDMIAFSSGASSTWFRYADGVMYSGSSSLLTEVTLPTRSQLRTDHQPTENHLQAVFDLTTLPQSLRTEFRRQIEAAAATALQRMDGEGLLDFLIRQAAGRLRLQLLQYAVTDVDQIRWTLKLPATVDSPLRTELTVTAQKNSELRKMLETLSARPTPLASLHEAGATMSLTTAGELPDWLTEAASETAAALRDSATTAQEHAEFNPGTALLLPLVEQIQTGRLETAIAMRTVEKNRQALVGALRLKDAEQFVAATTTHVLSPDLRELWLVQSFRVDEFNAVSFLQPDLRNPIVAEELPLQFSVCATDSWLWFVIADPLVTQEQRTEILREMIQSRDELSPATGFAELLDLRLEPEHCLRSADDPASRFPVLLIHRCEALITEAFRQLPPFAYSFDAGSATQRIRVQWAPLPFTSQAERFLTNGDSGIRIRITNNRTSLSASAELGAGIVRLLLARQFAAQNPDGSGTQRLRLIRENLLPPVPSPG